MAIATYQDTRDRGQPFKLISFEYSNGEKFNYTNNMDAITVPNNGRARIYISIDRSKEMQKSLGNGGGTRDGVARVAATQMLLQIKQNILSGQNQTYDIGLGWFSSFVTRRIIFGVTAADCDDLISEILFRAVDTVNSADLEKMVEEPVDWLSSSPNIVKSRSWVIFTGCEPNPATLAAAKRYAAPLVTQIGSEDVGFIGTDVYLFSAGNPDVKKVRFFDNTPSDGVPVILDPLDERVTNIDFQPKTHVFDSLPMQIDDIKIMASPTKQSIKLILPKDSEIAKYHLKSRSDAQMFMSIKKGQVGDEEGQLETMFSGRVISVARDPQKSTISMTCESLISSLRKNGLGRHYSRNCGHALYGDKCKADQSRVSTIMIPNIPTWNPGIRYLTFNPGYVLPLPPERYLNGIVWWIEDGAMIYRTIVKVFAGGFQLNGKIMNAYAAERINISIGCDHSPTACRTWHFDSETGLSNGVNYGGQDLIPLESPFKLKSQYY